MNSTWYKQNFTVLFIFGLSLIESQAQLGFCNGNSGDPIFMETFGAGTSNGPALAPGSTTYTYSNGTPNDGSYTISSTTSYFDWFDTPDHTPGDVNGKSFIVNASFTAGEFFRREVSGLCENTSYEFSSWLINLLPQSGCQGNGIPVNVKFQIWDSTDTILLATGNTGNIQGKNSPIWEQYGLVFQTQPGQTSVILKMINNGNGGCGNDLAIDDIVFRTCGDLISITNTENATGILICEDEIPVVTALTAYPDFSIYQTHAYQWQQSTDRENWTDIIGETGQSYVPPALISTMYYRVKVAEDTINVSNPLCNSLSQIFDIIIIPIPEAPVVNLSNVTLCPNNDETIQVAVPAGVIVNWYDSPIDGNLLLENSNSFAPTAAGTYYAEASSADVACYSLSRTAITINFYDAPIVTDEELTFCEGTSQLLSAGIENMSYSWNTGQTSAEIEVNSPGIYTVIVSNEFGCSTTKTISLNQIDIPVIDRIISEDYTLTITAINSGDFEYAINGGAYQRSNVFNNINGGRYTIRARSANACDAVAVNYIHLVIPKFFTPNGDAINDTFNPEGVDVFSTYETHIFDRYGNLIKSAVNKPLSWDGTMNNNALPSSDYWYLIKVDSARFQGHFSLKR
ncbi:T9SS type B sorting domain-containing protein [Muriicola sp. Z0-33]|uniref:T9SS type B sorting domain-containing protein n=1 Tax=Muriicola sp. Z0-33 TaxID=2816957 RepID=UPI002237C29F|nr:T9SS type B sorting domain-containing protein [Muriicola sp. Z0-33]MCW5515011.1 T9SS type B sorting domain-containing protein [Muriicola sp. Z0-33]